MECKSREITNTSPSLCSVPGKPLVEDNLNTSDTGSSPTHPFDNRLDEMTFEIFDDDISSNKSSSNIMCMKQFTHQTINKTPVGKCEKRKCRRGKRRNFCLFCQTLVSNFARHLLRRHGKEKEMIEYKKILDENLQERKKKRLIITSELRRKGNFLYNTSRVSDSEFLPCKRPSRNKKEIDQISNYLTCRLCLDMFKKNSFGQHIKKCFGNQIGTNTERLYEDRCYKLAVQSSKETTKQRYIHNTILPPQDKQQDCIELIPNVEGASDLLKEKVLTTLQRDEYGLIALNDSLILRIGSQFLSSHHDIKAAYQVRGKLRDSAKLLKECRMDPEIQNLSDCFNPRKFDFVMKAVQKLSGCDTTNGAVSVISMPARLSYILQEGAKILLCDANVKQIPTYLRDKIKSDINDFLRLFKSNRENIFSPNAEKTVKKGHSLKKLINCCLKIMVTLKPE